MSNVSYGNLKDWPEELQTHCYQLLKRLWLQEDIPQQWKEKWAVLLAKSADTAAITNLRSIGLEDCLRKLWFGIVYKRIADAWKEFEALDMAHHGFVPNRGQTAAFWTFSINWRRRRSGGCQPCSARGTSSEHLIVSAAPLYAWH